MSTESPEAGDQAPQEDVAVRNGADLPTVAAVWCVSGLVGAAVGSLGFLAFTYVAGFEPATTLPPPPPEHDDGTVCYTPGCLATTAYLQDALNPLVDPCRNFQEYVCGRFRGAYQVDGLQGCGPTQARDRIYLEVLAKATSYSMSKPGGARSKAAWMLHLCTRPSFLAVYSHLEVQRFMRRLKLNVHSPPPDAATGADDLLALHVELAYAYGLSGLMLIRPRGRHSLDIAFNHLALLRVSFRNIDYSTAAKTLALIAGIIAHPDLGMQMQSLYSAVQRAVASALQGPTGPNTDAAPRAVIKVKDAAFAGVSATAFANAVEAKTPYTKDASLFERPKLKAILLAVWRDMDKTDLFLWTSWYALETLGIFAELAVVHILGVERLSLRCVEMVSHVMDAALAMMIRLSDVTDKARAQVTAMTNSAASCLNRKQWTPSVPTSPRLIVGFPSYATTPERLDAYYEAFQVSQNGFLAHWLRAAEMRRSRLSPDDDHLDTLDVDVHVDTDGAVLVPAALFMVPLFVPDGPLAANVGGLGQVITMGLIERYFVGAATVPTECQALTKQPQGTDILSLLANSCVGPTLSAMNASHERRLPQLAELNPEKMAYTVGCLKDCGTVRTGAVTCFASAQGLKAFEEAFACSSEGNLPACSLE